MVSQKVLAATFLAGFITASSMAQTGNRPRTSATSQKPAPIDGEWIVADQTARIRIAPCGNGSDGAHCGTLVWTKTPGGVDSNNPDPAQRSKPLLGLEIVKDMKLKGQNLWEGSVYNAINGKTYSATLAPQSPTTLKIEGCILGGLLCDGEIWTRAVETGGTILPKPTDGTRPRAVQPR
ncbi:DUF2147 domain-containing protein [Microvirga sp. M2]|uniref:DUF2147 domain-containing protein n=1 Tax=Microvirga sp. M2 TaxID=3073270 RepID=UPI0039C3F1D4